MKPDDFIMNSDYLSIAQVGSDEFLAAFGGGTLTPAGSASGSYRELITDFSTTSQPGAIDRIMIKKDDGEYQSCSYMRLYIESSSNPYVSIAGFFTIYRMSSNTLRAQLVLENVSPNTATYPAMVFRIKVSSFKPPNIF